MSSTEATIETPPPTESGVDTSGTGFSVSYDVCSPGSNYIIVEMRSKSAITISNTGLCLRSPVLYGPNEDNTWLCCEKNNYLAFFNSKWGVYLGHDGGNEMRATAKALKSWEMMFTRAHRDGAHQLLVPFSSGVARIVTVAGAERKLALADHGDNSWMFWKCEQGFL